MKKVQEKALILSTFTSVLLSFAVVIGTVAFILLRTKQHREYDEKWKDYDPHEVTDSTTGEKKIQTRYCFSIATLTWNKKEQTFEFESVGLRYLQHRVDGLEDYILNFCEEMIKELDKEV